MSTSCSSTASPPTPPTSLSATSTTATKPSSGKAEKDAFLKAQMQDIAFHEDNIRRLNFILRTIATIKILPRKPLSQLVAKDIIADKLLKVLGRWEDKRFIREFGPGLEAVRGMSRGKEDYMARWFADHMLMSMKTGAQRWRECEVRWVRELEAKKEKDLKQYC